MKTLLLIAVSVLMFLTAHTQKVGYVELQQIMEDMPEYAQANEEIKRQSDLWKADIDRKFREVEDLYNQYMETEGGMTEEMRRQKQQEIYDAERSAKEMKDQKFGPEGELYQLQQKKFQPLTDRIHETIKKMALEQGYDFVFDKSSTTPWLYTNPEHNLTIAVRKMLGLE
ncbi:MAG: OmpH family outer membrane protein [Bacteroidales bacterium]|nr:OmpH family outer membrane protein [Bacteroidales bacterium]